MDFFINKFKTLTYLIFIIKRKINLFIIKNNKQHQKNRQLLNTYTEPKLKKVQEIIMKKKFNLNYNNKELYGYTQGNPYFFGYVILGNIYFEFVRALILEIKKDKIENLYFLSRDGEIIKKVYDVFQKIDSDLPKSKYLYASRRSLNILSINNISDVINIMKTKKFDECNIEDLLYNRFGIEKQKVINELKIKGYKQKTIKFQDKEQINKLLTILTKLIMEQILKEKNSLKKYYEKEGLTSNAKKAIVDIGHEGSLQSALYSYLGSKITGYYFATFHEIKKNVESKGMKTWGYVGNKIISKLNFYKSNILFLENIFLNSEKSFVSIIDDEIKTVEEKDSNRTTFASEVHKGIVDYIEDITDILEKDIATINLENNKKYLLSNLLNLISNPTMADTDMFVNILFENKYSCVKDRYLIDKNTIEDSIWKEGFIVSKK